MSHVREAYADPDLLSEMYADCSIASAALPLTGAVAHRGFGSPIATGPLTAEVTQGAATLVAQLQLG